MVLRPKGSSSVDRGVVAAFGIAAALSDASCIGTLESGAPLEPAPTAPTWHALLDAPGFPALGPCAPFETDEAILDVSSEGDAWLAASAGLRVVHRNGSSSSWRHLRGGRVRWALALGAETAIVSTDHGLFRVEGDDEEPLDIPASMGRPLEACGDAAPGAVFALATDLGLFARRDGAFWRIDLAGAPAHPWAGLAEQSGACTGPEDLLVVAHGESVFELDRDGGWARLLSRLGRPTALSRQGGLAAVASEGELRLRLEDGAVQRHRFDAGPVSVVSVGAGQVWAVAGTTLVRGRPAGDFERLDVGGDVHEVMADETGGAWVVPASRDRICRASTRDGLSIRGLTPHGQITGPRAFRVEAGLPATDLEVRVDGVLVHRGGSSDANDGWDVPQLDLGGAGWHRIEISAAVLGVPLERRLDVRLLAARSFARDVRPIVVEHCSGCHSATGPQTRLDEIAPWRSRGARILRRIAAGEMPPPPAPRLGAMEIEVIRDWMDGGMLP